MRISYITSIVTLSALIMTGCTPPTPVVVKATDTGLQGYHYEPPTVYHTWIHGRTTDQHRIVSAHYVHWVTHSGHWQNRRTS